MAAITTVSELYGVNSSSINLTTKTWKQVELGTNLHSIYLIAVKENVIVGDTIDANTIKQMIFEVGIDSGLASNPITIQKLILDVSHNELSVDQNPSIIGQVRSLNLPTSFYIRCVQMINKNGDSINKGILTSIDININPLNLGWN